MKSADKTALEALIAEVNALLTGGTAYTGETLAALNTVLSDAMAIVAKSDASGSSGQRCLCGTF